MPSRIQDLRTALDLCHAGRLKEAAELYRNRAAPPPSTPPDRVENLLLEGQLATELARWEDAIGIFTRASELAPQAPAAWSGLGYALLGARCVEQGMAACRTALDLDPGHAPALRVVALGLLRQQRLAEAEETARAAVRAAPGYPEGLAALALVRMMQGRMEEADTLFRQATSAKPGFAEAMGNHAALLARRGRDAEAMREAQRAVEIKPFLAGPQHLLGTLWRRLGRPGEAATAFAQAITADPDHMDARANLADALRLLGRPEEAVAACLAGLERQPDHAGLHANLGAALQVAGRSDAALAAYERALRLVPNLPEVSNNLARLHQEAGRLDEAITLLQQAQAARPGNADLAGNLAAALLAANRPEEAGKAAAAAVHAAPRSPDALCLLGQSLGHLDRPDEAEAAFREAIRLDAGNPDRRIQAAHLFLRTGRRDRALPYCRQAARMNPDNARIWTLLDQALHGVRFTAADAELRAELLKALSRPGAEPTHLVEAVVSVIDLNPAMIHLRQTLAAADPVAEAVAQLRGDRLEALADDALLIALLGTTPVPDPAFEQAFTLLRHALLRLAGSGEAGPLDTPAWLPLVCALARQCFLNEYVFFETEDEANAAERLGRALAAALGRRAAPSPARVALYAAYRPLGAWEAADALARSVAPPALADLLRQQIEEVRTEAALKRDIPRLTAVDDAVSLAVRAQYEENPYPRWCRVGLLDEPLPVQRVLRAMFPHAALPPGPWEAPEILVAGCGTGRESVWAANQFKGARVLAVDLSLTSLAYARRQTESFGLDSVSYAQADILRLGEIGRRFDIIQCVGVLHHMADPLRGWRVLTGLLRPHGIMKIGLYSERARSAIVAARALIAERGYGASPMEIRRFRREALALPAGHPAKPMTRSADFYNTSACRDLVFHVQEHRMTLPQIAGWLAELDLELLGFQLEDPAVVHLYRRRFPEDPAMTALDLWDRFEAEHPLTFGGLYQFWVRRRT